MCGIFGYIETDNVEKFDKIFKKLFLLSESRGKEASGLAIIKNDFINIYKAPLPASGLIKTTQYKNIIKLIKGSNKFTAIGHARLVTNGSLEISDNNQPVIKDGIVGVHNGIIVNDNILWEKYPELKRNYEVDTEILLSLIKKNMPGTNIVDSIIQTYQEIQGTASIALIFQNSPYIVLATNNGSLYWAHDSHSLIFASEEYILSKVNAKLNLKYSSINQLKAKSVLIVSSSDINERYFLGFKDIDNINLNIFHPISKKIIEFKFNENDKNKKSNNHPNLKISFKKREVDLNILPNIKRCGRCILPETMPFIEFDENSICNYCRNHKKTEIKGLLELKNWAANNRGDNFKYNCLVALSGGRDSSYGLHYIKKELDMNPIALSYDWGMLTDLGRRNQARMCGKLGIEHLLVSADIRKKRYYIRKNVQAWLKKPDLGTIPLFMAGDKQYFYHINKFKNRLRIKHVIYSENQLEKTDFKTGFCGIAPKFNIKHVYDFNSFEKINLVYYYTKNYLLNPSLINLSLFNTFTAYMSSYFITHDYLYLFQYIKWDEEEINKVLINEYDWELATDTKSTWRIGDGTAAFYNYIYYTVAGFTENDTFRSNQVREGIITREEALKRATEENRPRFESIKWYCDTIGIDFEKTIDAINKIPKLYER